MVPELPEYGENSGCIPTTQAIDDNGNAWYCVSHVTLLEEIVHVATVTDTPQKICYMWTDSKKSLMVPESIADSHGMTNQWDKMVYLWEEKYNPLADEDVENARRKLLKNYLEMEDKARRGR